MPTLATHRKARYDYEVLETLEAGLVLTGQEVKSVRAGQMVLAGAFVHLRANGPWLVGANIPPYAAAGPLPHYDASASRRLLINRAEIRKIQGKMERERLTLIPLCAYTRGRRIKVEIGLCRGKRTHDKRAAIRDREVARELRTRQYRSVAE
jgi:SsrA-binding protein